MILGEPEKSLCSLGNNRIKGRDTDGLKTWTTQHSAYSYRKLRDFALLFMGVYFREVFNVLCL
jgi:hypothetical protein